MKPRTIVLIVLLASAAAASRAHARESLPDPRTQRYSIHKDPSETGSPVTWAVELSLDPQSVDGDTVAWSVTKITVTAFDKDGKAERVWANGSPTLHTSDGLWRIEHEDPLVPKNAEFTLPPWITCTANPTLGTAVALNVQWQGVTVSAPPQVGFTNPAAFVDFQFVLQGQQAPEVEGDDEPVEVDSPIQPGGG